MSYGLVMWLGGIAFGAFATSIFWLAIGVVVQRGRHRADTPVPIGPVAAAEAITRDAAQRNGAP